MPTGIEDIGLVLAILPLVMAAAKCRTRASDSSKDAVSQSRQDFFDVFYCESYVLQKHMIGIIRELPILCEHCKHSLQTNLTLEDWEEDGCVNEAVFKYFGIKEDLDDFLVVLSEVLDMFDKLIKEPSDKISQKEKNASSTYLRLKSFVTDSKAGATLSSLTNRVKFWKRERNQEISIRNLDKWNSRLKELISKAEHPRKFQVSTIEKVSPSFADVRKLFCSLLDAIESYSKCDCQIQHDMDIMLSLKHRPQGVYNRSLTQLEFELLLARRSDIPDSIEWLDATFLVQAQHARGASNNRLETKPLERLCGILVANSPSENSLQFLVRVSSTPIIIWQLRSRPLRFHFLNETPRRSLEEFLFHRELTSFKDKRRLALALAYAFIQYYGSPYASEILNAGSIYFYSLTENRVDFERPFVVKPRPGSHRIESNRDMDVQHPCLSLLTLGIRLLEIHKGRPLEHRFMPREQGNPSPNSTLAAARREYHKLEESCSIEYKNAIRACLEVGWVSPGEKVDLQDQRVSDGFYQDVIENLKHDTEYL